MHTKSDNEEIMVGSDTSDVIKELFKSFLQRYQEGLQEKIKGSDVEFDGVNLLYYDFNKISLNSSGSCIESAKWIKDKKSTINPKNNDYKCFQYAVTVALNHDKINNHPQKVSKIKPLIDQYNWNGIDFPSTSKENYDYCHVEMPNEDNKIIKYNQGEKSIKLPFIIYADLECLLEKMNACHINPEESSITEINKHTPSGYSLFTHSSFDKTKNKLDYYRGKDCMKKLCKDLREHATKIINYQKRDMIPLTKKEEENHNKQKVCYICKKEFNTGDSDKKHHKVKDHCHYTGKYRGAAHNICNLRYKIPKEIS